MKNDPGTTPLARFHQLVQDHADQGIDHPKKLYSIYLKMLPAGIMGRLEDWRYRRRVRKTRLHQPPLYLLGHWRSGTSFLQFLLGQDPNMVYHSKFQTFFPKSFLLTEDTVKPVAKAFLNGFSAISAWRDGISLDMGLDTPSEIEVSLMNEGSPVSFHWGHVFPQSWQYYFDRFLFQDDLTKREIRQWERDVHRLNRKVQLKRPKSRLMVKNPGDTARINRILALYPDARFVFLHRDPYDVFYSNIKLWQNLLKNLSLQHLPHDELKRAILYTYRRMHQAYLEQRSLIPSGNLVEIPHRTLSSDPMGTAKTIYQELGLEGWNQACPALEAYAKTRQKTYQIPNYNYHPEDIEAIEREWRFMFEAFGYPVHKDKKRAFGT